MKNNETVPQEVKASLAFEFTSAVLQQLPRGITPEQMKYWIGKKGKLANFLQGLCNADTLLEFVNTITIPASTKKFVAKDKFVIDTSDDAPVKIDFISYDFKKAFLQGNGKIEQPSAKRTLCCSKLLKDSLDIPIINELGGKEKVETTLRDLFFLLEKQPNGEDGDLLTDGCANIFYICNTRGVLCAVHVHWYSGGWYLCVFSVEYPFEWDAGLQIFSRNS